MIDGDGNFVIFGRTHDVRNIIGAGNMSSYMPRVLRTFSKFPFAVPSPSAFSKTQ